LIFLELPSRTPPVPFQKLWVTGYGLRLFLLLCVYWSIYLNRRRASTPEEVRAVLASQRMRALQFAKNILEMAGLAWYVHRVLRKCMDLRCIVLGQGCIGYRIYCVRGVGA
jgi:hypothetical protein